MPGRKDKGGVKTRGMEEREKEEDELPFINAKEETSRTRRNSMGSHPETPEEGETDVEDWELNLQREMKRKDDERKLIASMITGQRLDQRTLKEKKEDDRQVSQFVQYLLKFAGEDRNWEVHQFMARWTKAAEGDSVSWKNQWKAIELLLVGKARESYSVYSMRHPLPANPNEAECAKFVIKWQEDFINEYGLDSEVAENRLFELRSADSIEAKSFRAVYNYLDLRIAELEAGGNIVEDRERVKIFFRLVPKKWEDWARQEVRNQLMQSEIEWKLGGKLGPIPKTTAEDLQRACHKLDAERDRRGKQSIPSMAGEIYGKLQKQRNVSEVERGSQLAKEQAGTAIIRANARIDPPELHVVRKAEHDTVDEFLKEGIIRPSYSSFSAPTHLVTKKDGGWRLCLDYRELNKVTIRDTYPLPRIEDLIYSLRGAKFFALFDLAKGFHQIPVAEGDKYKTAFSVHGRGMFEFNQLPMGLMNAVATCQRFTETMLADMLNVEALVYLDDICVYAHSFEEFCRRLKKLLLRVLSAKAKFKRSKCTVGTRCLEYLGHTVSAYGILPSLYKTKDIRDYALPTTKKSLMTFLGLTGYYRKFVEGYSSLVTPLAPLVKATAPLDFEMTPEQKSIFFSLRKKLITAPILAMPSFKKPFILKTDASQYACGAILAQEDDDGMEHPILYDSKKFSEAEQKWSTRNKKLTQFFGLIKSIQFTWKEDPLH